MPYRRTNLRGRRGSLQELPHMPLDIVFEVFSYMQPMDLLNLARTNRPFRDLLMSRTSAQFWKAARRNVDGLPDCPPDLNEPAYANLCFDAHCHNCMKTNIQNVIWEFRTRYCSDCRKFMTAPQYSLIENNLDDPFDPLHIVVNLNINPKDEDDPVNRRVHSVDIDSFYEEFDRLPSDQKGALIQREDAENEQIVQHANLCYAWTEQWKASRAQEKEDAKNKRVVAIINKLIELGYTEELTYMSDPAIFEENPLLGLSAVRRPGPLTERSWQSIRKTVIELMDFYRGQLEVHEAGEYYRHRVEAVYNALAQFWTEYRLICPKLRDFVSTTQGRKMVEAEHIAITVEGLRPHLPAIVDEWKEDLVLQLNQLIREQWSSLPQYVNLTTLAVCSYFYCMPCYSKRPIPFPQVLVHECLSSRPPNLDEPDEDLYEAGMDKMLSYTKWTPRCLKSCVGHLHDIISACGQESTKVTPEEMDRLDIRLFCQKCSSMEPNVRKVFSWREAVSHVLLDHHGCDTSSEFWGRMPARHASLVLRLEARMNARLAEVLEQEPYWYCSHCPAFKKIGSAEMALQHVEEEHNIRDASEDNIFCSPDVKITHSHPIFLVSDAVRHRRGLGWEVVSALERKEAAIIDFA
ncbi:unnamed protein product [Somion occarium]|uniref:F-box domain-containing protein n=1 Tax=Somion occarium TaxID=3059160 RepID=A0ABP1CFP2_9APHY